MRKLMAALGLIGGACVHAASPVQLAASLVDLSLEQLSSIVVSTVSGRDETLARAAASVYVISGEDIRRSGATSLGEALRLEKKKWGRTPFIDQWSSMRGMLSSAGPPVSGSIHSDMPISDSASSSVSPASKSPAAAPPVRRSASASARVTKGPRSSPRCASQ